MNPFWQFSLALYERPGVADACLDLQDRHGMDVNMLLYACFAAARGAGLDAAAVEALDSACAPWRDGVIRPLRELRRRAGDDFGATEVNTALLTAELAAERVQQDRMWAIAGQRLERDSPGAIPLAQNLAAVAACSGVSDAEVASLAALLGEILPVLLAEQ